MTERLPDPVRLTRCNPNRNMARFYVLALQPTLFGEITLLRYWGRIGARGQEMMETFSGVAAAGIALGKLERAKRRKGYRGTAEITEAGRASVFDERFAQAAAPAGR